jgi:trk system potassium uptake protein
MTWQQFRERANLFLFKNKERTLGVFKGINILVTLVALGTMIWMYGFTLSPYEEHIAYLFIKTGFAFYAVHYLTKIVYDFHPLEFIRRTWFEGLIMLVLIVEGIFYSLTGNLILTGLFNQLGMRSFAGLSTVFIQVYFFVVVLIEFIRNSELMPRVRLNPAFIFVLSFIFLILIGTFLLMLPEMTVNGGMHISDALFTATSSTCVTGLMTVDTHTAFTFKGQLVILLLIKLGGLNIVAFGGFLALVSKLGVGIKHHQVIEGFVSKNNILSAKGMLGKVILWTSSFEILGSISMYYLWDPGISWKDNGERVFYSIFHSVSAFNNAGISLFTDGLYNEAVRYNYLVHWVVILLIFFGSLGILVLFDLFEFRSLRDRLRYPWKQIQFPSKVSLYVSLLLVGLGSVFLFLLERNGTLAGQSLFGQVTGAVFQAVTPRTAGYNTVNFGTMGVPSLMIIIALMYIGAGSGSTGGGIKTSSLAILFADIRAVMTGAQHTVLWKRTISPGLKSTAYSVAVIYIIMNFIGTVLLSITESHILAIPGKGLLDIMFEQFSAFSTVGLSMGITSLLSVSGKYILVASMFIGRVGTFTIAFALAGHFVRQRYKYPEADLMIG